MKSYKVRFEIFKIMEVAEKIYEVRNTYKNLPRAYANCASHVRKIKWGESAPHTIPETVCTDKRKTRNTGHPNNRPTGGKTCLLHGPGHSTEECKVLRDQSAKYAAQRPHKE